ncbi:MAG TPA: formyltransferase family protein [Burkholderiaceae bacterium]|nr:formyltransferase family protein [Burkholderiaceae bacterium]
MALKITLVGSRFFGAAVLDQLVQLDITVLQVVAPAADDRLLLRAQALKLPAIVQHDPKHVPANEIANGTELIVAAHTHARVDADALAKSRHGGIGYHPSLLPRHRGIAAVEWTIKSGDPIAGGSIYHLAERMDAGAIAAQDWCFVKPGETARELWERALAPMGIRLLAQVVAGVSASGVLPAQPQDEQFATLAPKLPR